MIMRLFFPLLRPPGVRANGGQISLQPDIANDVTHSLECGKKWRAWIMPSMKAQIKANIKLARVDFQRLARSRVDCLSIKINV